ncbi:MAG TPA: MCP four helix bundle domain-containing protein, partial [Methylophilaceae bacterium]|nr:MCP four helix bundle domain-containing protein [Methylophilaceae bacterium]
MRSGTKMTIGKRLFLLILAASIGLVGLAGVGYYQIGKVFNNANEVNVNSLPSILILNQARQAFNSMRIQVSTHVLSFDAVKKAEMESNIKSYRENIESSLKQYEALISDATDKGMLEADHAALNEFYPRMEAVLALSRENRLEEARDYYMSNGPFAQKINSALTAHGTYNIAIA